MKRMPKIITVILIFAFMMQLLPANLGLPFFAEELQPQQAEQTEQSNDAQEESQPYILSELTNERDVYVKRFTMSDGTTQAAQYDTPVHFKNQDGRWTDYDNTLEYAEERGLAELQNKSSDLHIRLSQKQMVVNWFV